MAEARYQAILADGTPIWLPEEQFKQWKAGTLDLDRQRTPEEEADLQQKLEYMRTHRPSKK